MLKKIKFMLEKNRYVKKVLIFIYANTYGHYKHYQENKNFLKNADEVLVRVDNVFNELNIKYWLDFGTLLGAYRNGDFLQHDEDLDFGAYLHDYTPSIEKKFKKYGFKKTKEFLIDKGEYGREETYEYHGVQVDIFFYTQLTNSKAYYHDFVPIDGMSRDKTIDIHGGLIPREITLALEGIGEIEFKGKKVPVPLPMEEHLEDRYGEDFMIENKNWNLGKEKNKNIKILKNKIGIRYLYDK
jgi:hypothetical protein